jgi:phosphoglycolate phosphatase
MAAAGRRFDLVVFDLDGTLADTLPDIAGALRATLEAAAITPPPLDVVRQLVGQGAARLIERALPASEAGRDLGPLVARWLDHYRGHLCDGTRLYPGVAALLDRLAGEGVVAAVVTNKPASIARALVDALGISPRLAAVVGDGDGFPRKPDPAAVHALLARFGAVPARVAVVGDGLPDVQVARAVPCTSVAAAWGYVPAAALAAESPTFLAATVDEAARFLLG